MTEQRELQIPHTDLLQVVIECKCGTELMIDFTNKEDVIKTDWEHKLLRCPVCNNLFDSNLRLGFENFIRWQEQIKVSGQIVYFRIKPSN